MTKVIEVRDIWQSYDKLEVLKGISFDVNGRIKRNYIRSQ